MAARQAVVNTKMGEHTIALKAYTLAPPPTCSRPRTAFTMAGDGRLSVNRPLAMGQTYLLNTTFTTLGVSRTEQLRVTTGTNVGNAMVGVAGTTCSMA